MAGSIGGIACSFLRGSLPALKQRSEIWQRSGYDGYGIALLGEGDADASLQAELLSSQAGVTAWYALLQALQGQIITAVNDHGQTASVFVAQVGPLTRETRFVPGTVVSQKGSVAMRVIVTQ